MTNDEMRMQTADPEQIVCRDCIYRDRDTMTIGEKLVQTGVMRGTCLIFDGKSGNWKPTAVTLDNKACLFYEKE